MSERRVATVLLALLVVLWVGGCAATAPGPGEVEVSGSAPSERLTVYADLGEVAVEAVQDLWGQDALAWPVRVELPASSAQFDELTGINSAQTAVPASTSCRWRDARVWRCSPRAMNSSCPAMCRQSRCAPVPSTTATVSSCAPCCCAWAAK